MSDKLIELARECGAHQSAITDAICMTPDQLAAYTDRVRADAMEEAAKIAEGECPQNPPADWTPHAHQQWGIVTRCARAIRKQG